jgi:phosphoglycerate dehydrogenase-like enzyme
MEKSKEKYNLLIVSYLEPHHVERIRNIDSRINVLYEPSLIPPKRFPSDHIGATFQRTDDQEIKWLSLLRSADILFDFDRSHYEDLPVLAPNVKWLQATSSGIGQTIKNMKYDERMPSTVFTSASGVHRRPLAEFCLMVMLAFNKKLLQTLDQQRAKQWKRLSGSDLNNKTIAIVGMGKVGQEVARISKCFGMNVLGVKRTVAGIDPESLYADELFSQKDLNSVLSRSEYLVLIAPHTHETEKMIGSEQLSLLPKGAVLINIGRGALVDEGAMIEALQSGHLGGAGLDVFEVEPLPESSPLWSMSNVIVNPHSGGTSNSENELITDIFCSNIKNFLEGKPLINVIDTNKMF